MEKISQNSLYPGIQESEIKAGRLVVCPHCNGYGSSFKDPPNVNKCSFCGGNGVVPDYMAERYEFIYADKKDWRPGLKRYYLDHSSVFDNPENIYNFGVFSEVIKKAGGTKLEIEPNLGWNNQPDVITFLADEKTISQIKKALDSLEVFKKWGCILREKNWK